MAVAEMTHTGMLRAFADWLEQHPEADQTSIPSATLPGYRVLDARAWAGEEMTQLARSIGGRWDKEVDDTYFWLRQEILPGVIYCLYVPRNEVCEAVVVGKEIVEVPDPAAPKLTVERDVIEWRCPDSLLEGTA